MMKYNITIVILLIMSQLQAQITREWAATFNGEGDYNDRFTCMTRNTAGEVLLGGSTTEPDEDRDFLVAKIDASGNKIWQKRFNGPSGGPDEVRAVGVDAAGFTYITGISRGISTSEDIWTIKLDLNGDSVWSRRYDYVLEYDQPNALFVTTDGDIVVTGQSDNDPSAILNDDYITIKYNAAGDVLWQKRFNGLGNAIDRAIQVAGDPFGNTIVTGRSDNGFNDDFVTIKYDPSGNIEWALYDDRGNRDRPTAMTVDANGAIYITGRSSNGTDDDFWTLKYNGAGIQQWNSGFDYLDQDRPVAISTDANGRVYVTGQSNNTNDWDFLTVVYSSTGTQLWSKRYAGAAGGDDIPFAMNVTGNTLFVTGQSDTDPSNANVNNLYTIAYNPANGNKLWDNTYLGTNNREASPSSITGFADGCLVAGYVESTAGRRDALLVAYQSTGNIAWSTTTTGVGDNNDNVRAIGLDPSGNIYAAGYSVGGGDNRNMALLKFTATGGLDCSFTLDGDGTGSEDDAQAMAFDLFGNPVAAGFTKNSGSSNDLTFFKTNYLCDTLWTRKYDGSGHGSDRIYDMVAAPDGTFYATGRVDAAPGAPANDNCITLHLDADGYSIWSKTYDGGSADRGVGIRVAPNGDVYVLGRSLITTGQHDIFLVKYNSSGVQQWLKTYNAGGNDEPKSIEITNDQRIVIGGSSTLTPNDTAFDAVALCYNSGGNLLWQKKYDRGGNDEVQEGTIDNAGNFFLTAQSRIGAGDDIVVLKYNAAGDLVWDAVYNGNPGGNDIPDDIKTAASGAIYVTGHINTGTTELPVYDVATFILNPEGQLIWSDVYAGPTGGSDIPNRMLVNGNTFYVAGSSEIGDNQRDILLLKYSGQLVNAIAPEATGIAVWPNPFTTQVNIDLPATVSEAVTFELFNALGEKVVSRSIFAARQQLVLPEIPNGVYTYRIATTAEVVKTGILLKSE